MKLDRLFGWLRWLNPLRLLRRKEQPKRAAAPPAVTPAQPQTALAIHRLRVLIVDKDQSFIDFLTRQFQQLGHEVQSALILNKAYVVSAQWKPELIVYGNLANTSQWWFAHAILGNDKRGLWDPPLPDRPYLVRLCDQWLHAECAYSYEFGFDVCEGRRPVTADFMRWCDQTREMLRSR